jgi:hypothetical protein
MRCLEKKPADRWQRPDELLAQLEQAGTPSGGVTPVATVPPSAVTGRRSGLAVAAVASVGLIAGGTGK